MRAPSEARQPGWSRAMTASLWSGRRDAAGSATARRLRGVGLVLVAQAHPVHGIGQAFLVAAERGEIQVLIGGVHHVEPTREAGIGVEDLAPLVAIEHADA